MIVHQKFTHSATAANRFADVLPPFPMLLTAIQVQSLVHCVLVLSVPFEAFSVKFSVSSQWIVPFVLSDIYS